MGTKSLLVGVHQVILHPIFVLMAWVKLFGWPQYYQVYFAMLVHDIGYWNRKDMDGIEGKNHPWLGAKIMSHLFDFKPWGVVDGGKWGEFTLFHSRSIANQYGRNYSDLCISDKYATCMYPCWLYLFLANMSGEIHEYLEVAKSTTNTTFSPMKHAIETGQDEHTVQQVWFHCLCEYMKNWTEEAMK